MGSDTFKIRLMRNTCCWELVDLRLGSRPLGPNAPRP